MIYWFQKVFAGVFAVETSDTIGGKFSLALTTLILGMLTVFAALIVIMVVVQVIGKIFAAVDKKKAAKEAEQKALTPAPETAPEAVENTEAAADEGEIVAAITAAVALYLEEPVGSFRVVSFKKTKAVPAWNRK